VLVAQSAHLPAWMDTGEEVEDLLVEKRVPRLDRRVHCRPVPLETEKMPGKMDARRPIRTLVQRVPGPEAFEIGGQLEIRIVIPQERQRVVVEKGEPRRRHQ